MAELADTHEQSAPSASKLITPDVEQALVRKIDIHVLPGVIWLLLLSYIDRSNLGNVKVTNKDTGRDIVTELHLSDVDWQLAISIFYIGFVFAEIPYTLLFKRAGPSRWLARIIVSWGITALCHGLVSNATGLILCRFFLGLAEAGFFPGVVLYFAYWYKQREFATRVAFFTSATALSSAFSGLLAYAIGFANGASGLSGWRWIFIIEGIPSIVSGFSAWFLLPDFPHTASWLTDEEKEFAAQRLSVNAPSATRDKNFDLDEFLEVITDLHSWLINVIFFCGIVSGITLLYWLPTIILNLGFAGTLANVLTVPPWIVSWFVAVAVSWHSDKTQERIWHLIAPSSVFLLAIIFFATVPPTPGAGAGFLYFTTFLATAGSASVAPILWAWRASTSKGATGTATALALTNTIGACGGAISSFIFRADWAPRYVPAFAICAVLEAIAIAGMLVKHFWSDKIDILQERIRPRRRALYNDKQVIDGETKVINEEKA
ncbi:MFS general substrate transporter [Gonapodya prolifera JEL478]|uniref:MFS general substrate transporter n=1 Tax=Gonapodya prolifera (strain JEL478) TaxID=1344416 RepID=A0A139AYD9_GONPJ|nr:MFS general substrate transporter [Gonapodya prolifera JEL478]|eukprot:KXS21761.1 MFS general substrate transporter [Gonapodya prolifera JEL478]